MEDIVTSVAKSKYADFKTIKWQLDQASDVVATKATKTKCWDTTEALDG